MANPFEQLKSVQDRVRAAEEATHRAKVEALRVKQSVAEAISPMVRRVLEHFRVSAFPEMYVRPEVSDDPDPKHYRPPYYWTIHNGKSFHPFLSVYPRYSKPGWFSKGGEIERLVTTASLPNSGSKCGVRQNCANDGDRKKFGYNGNEWPAWPAKLGLRNYSVRHAPTEAALVHALLKLFPPAVLRALRTKAELSMILQYDGRESYRGESVRDILSDIRDKVS